MLRGSDTLRLVMIDFGLSLETSYIPVNVHPTGSQAHWSPEKAASEGYDFGADVWAAVAVFVHMLAGCEPWVTRYKENTHLHYIVSWLLLLLLLLDRIACTTYIGMVYCYPVISVVCLLARLQT